MSSPRTFSGPLFVVGMPRSGTKLLRGLLNSHSAIGIPLNETEFLPYLQRHWPQFGDLATRERFDAFYQWMGGTFYFQNRQREHGKQIDQTNWYLACKGDFSLPNVFEQLIRHDAAVDEQGVWGDKSPSYINHLPVLKRLYPQAKFIHIIRDVRDYVLSMEKAFGKDRYRAAQRWVTDIERLRRDALAFPADVHHVYYEALLDKPSTVLEDICQFLELPFEAAMLSLNRPTENLGDTVGQQEIVIGNYGKYKTQMNDTERRDIEAIAGELLIALNYPCQYRGERRILSTKEMQLRQIKDVMSIIKTDARRNGWRYTIRSRVGNFIKLRS